MTSMVPGSGARVAIIWIICLTMGAVGCLASHATPAADRQVKVQVGQVGVDRQTGSHYVLLRDRDGRSLPITIGDDEARAILLAMHGIRMERPLTDQLLSTVIRKTGNHVDRAVVNDLRNQTYYAYLELDDGRYKIDCRPSDAIALAMDTDAPIYVTERLMQNAAAETPSSGKLPSTTRRLGLTLQELTPDLAGYFNAAPSSGLLVVEADGPAASAGVSRGDILIRLGGEPMKTLDAFGVEAAKLGKGAPITMLVNHAGVERTITFTIPPEPRG